MSYRRSTFRAPVYILTCTCAAGFTMFIYMAAGELLVNPKKFRGFLGKPRIWSLIFLESATRMIPMALVSLPFLWSLRKLKESDTKLIVVGGWAALGVSPIALYKTMYFTDE